MESVRDSEPVDLQIVRFEPGDDRLQGLLLTRQCNLAGTVEGCDRDLVLVPGDGGSHPGSRRTHGHHRTALRQRLHQATARGNQLKTVFETEDTRYTGGDELANTVAQRPGGLDAPGLPHLGQGILDRKQGRLSIRGFVDRRVRSLFSIDDGQQGSIDILAYELVTLIHNTPEDRLRLVKLAPHVDILRSLSREQECHARNGVALDNVARRAGDILARAEFHQRVGGFGGRGRRKREAVGEMGTPCRGRKADVGEWRVRVAQRPLVSVCELVQTLSALRREREKVPGPFPLRGLRLRGRRSLFENHVRIRATEAKRADTGQPGPAAALPWDRFGRHAQGRGVPVEMRRWPVEV